MNDENIENVVNIVYLGSMFTNNHDDSKEIKKDCALQEMQWFPPLTFGKTKLSQRKPKKTTSIFSLLNCHLWFRMLGAQNLETSDKKRIEAFELWCFLRLLRISWTDKKTNAWILENINCKERLLTTIKRKMSFIGHIIRSDLLEKDLLVGSVYGSRKRGRPKTRISDNIKETSGKSFVDLFRLAQDRRKWRAAAVQL